MKFYNCNACGNISILLGEKNGDLSCCDIPMAPMQMNAYKGIEESHIPQLEYHGVMTYFKIRVADHPKEKNHYIAWILIEYRAGFEIKYFQSKENPEIIFPIEKYEQIVNIYSYCNVHGIWKREIKHF